MTHRTNYKDRFAPAKPGSVVLSVRDLEEAAIVLAFRGYDAPDATRHIIVMGRKASAAYSRFMAEGLAR